MYQKRPYERAPDRPDHRACHDMTDGRACTPLGGTLILRVITWAHYLGSPGPSTSQNLGTFLRFSEDLLGRERERDP